MSLAPVSGIIPCYRCEYTIERAVESAWRQTLRPAEMILVDDCSDDSTWSTLERLETKYSPGWIRLIRLKRNFGQGTARNVGWNAAQMPYIAFLDSDDTWHFQKIERQYKWMIEHPGVDMTAHACRSLIARMEEGIEPFPPKSYRIRPIHMIVQNRMLTRSVMLRQSIAERFPMEKRYSEDYYLFLKLILQGYAAWYLHNTLAFSYKPEYGASGLTGNILSMERGEIDTFMRLHREGLLSALAFWLGVCISVVKFMKRVYIVQMRSVMQQDRATHL